MNEIPDYNLVPNFKTGNIKFVVEGEYNKKLLEPHLNKIEKIASAYMGCELIKETLSLIERDINRYLFHVFNY